MWPRVVPKQILPLESVYSVLVSTISHILRRVRIQSRSGTASLAASVRLESGTMLTEGLATDIAERHGDAVAGRNFRRHDRTHDGIVKVQGDAQPGQKELGRLREVFSNATSLGLSFRPVSKIGKDFLTAGPEIDFEALESFVTLCKQNERVQLQVMHALVHNTCTFRATCPQRLKFVIQLRRDSTFAVS